MATREELDPLDAEYDDETFQKETDPQTDGVREGGNDDVQKEDVEETENEVTEGNSEEKDEDDLGHAA